MTPLTDAIHHAGSALETSPDGFAQEFVFAEDFIGFDGHFPGNPILPAMVQLMVGAHTVREAAGNPLATHGVSRAKFVRPIHPNERMTVQGTLKNKGKATIAPITIRVGDEVAATFTVTLNEENHE